VAGIPSTKEDTTMKTTFHDPDDGPRRWNGPQLKNTRVALDGTVTLDSSHFSTDPKERERYDRFAAELELIWNQPWTLGDEYDH
jgi:hypothetical protein